ncbi:MAG: UDP-N-acetylmuramoyl-tripeptide--D-alanyl-D-alanine ligase [Synechococcus sp.]|nr:UDP-N-acetylmuramoyl-tripeptide--D-alanyl-D-alanine ligase [Synechococcus sp.]
MEIRLSQLVELWGPPLGAPPAADGEAGAEPWQQESLPASAIVTDSRRLRPGDLFVALVGECFDGHAFLEAALQSGQARAAVAQADRVDGALRQRLEACGRPVWLLPDSLLAYQQLGGLWRRQLGAPVVAVTGSAGKTTTRELIRSALAPLGAVVASSGNENNDIGVPLTLLKADAGTAALVVEMGMRGPGEIERLTLCASPDVAVITNIGTAHIGRLGSREAIGLAKAEITQGLGPEGLLVIPAGDPLLEACVARGWSGAVQRVALADDTPGAAGLPAPDWSGHLQSDGTRMRVQGHEREMEVALPLEGRHNARNLLLALAVARHLGVAPESLSSLAVEVPGGRNRRRQVQGLTVLDETYNASPEAVLAALELLARQPGRRFAVLGTMLELGEQSLALHRQVAARAAALGLDGLVLVDGGPEGDAMEEEAAGLPRLARVRRAPEAIEPLRAWLKSGDVLLLKASRGVALEQVLPLLLEQESWT